MEFHLDEDFFSLNTAGPSNLWVGFHIRGFNQPGLKTAFFSFPAAVSQLDQMESAAFSVWLGAPEDGRRTAEQRVERLVFDGGGHPLGKHR